MPKPTHAASSGIVDRRTPDNLFREIEWHWGPFDVDACATKDSAKVRHYITPEMDAFTTTPVDVYRKARIVFMNPPYGRGVTWRWLELARRWARELGLTVVCLIPASSGALWWAEHVAHARERAEPVTFLEGRVHFLDANNDPMEGGADFDSAIVVYRPPFGWPHWNAA